MATKDYRVLEHHGEFFIEVFDTKRIKYKFWPWEKDLYETDWHRCGVSGGYANRFNPAIDSFKTLKKAKKLIDLFLSEDKTHYIQQ